MFFVVIFISPLYFFFREKWGAFVINGILYVIACFGVLSVVFSWGGVIFWAIAVAHAGWHLREEHMEKHAEMVATKTREQMMKDNKNDTDMHTKSEDFTRPDDS